MIQHAVWLYQCFSLNLRDVEPILAARGEPADPMATSIPVYSGFSPGGGGAGRGANANIIDHPISTTSADPNASYAPFATPSFIPGWPVQLLSGIALA